MPTKTQLPTQRLGREAEVISLAQAAWKMAKSREFTFHELTQSVAIIQHELARASGIPIDELSDRISAMCHRIETSRKNTTNA